MKKLLLILLCVPLITLFNSCSSSGGGVPTPILENVIVDKIWEIKDGTERFYLNSSDGKLYTKDDLCDDFSSIGDYNIIENSITYTYDSSSFQITKLFEIVDIFSENEISFLYDVSTSSVTSIIYNKVDPALLGCMDLTALNYDSLANCPDSCIYALYNFTYVPDDNFEQALINLGYDNVLDDYVLTANIKTLETLDVGFGSGFNTQFTDLTGIEDFTALTYLNVSLNQLTSLDVSNNTALTYLDVTANHQLTSLDVSNNTALEYLVCTDNQLTSLDVSNNPNLIEFWCSHNQLTSLDVSNNTALTYLNVSLNQLTSLDVSQNTALTDLRCSHNQLTSLDVSNNTDLYRLSCSHNQLTSLDVRNGNNVNITTFFTSSNPNLYCIDVDDSTWSTASWTNIDPQHYFSLTCP
jgi:hypothetical protein